MKINLDKYIIDDRIFDVKFSCDLNMCKGACCTIQGTDGAPLLEKEIPIMKHLLPKVEKYLPEKHLDVIKREGFYYRHDNDFAVSTYNDNECVFSFYDGKGIAKCAFQTAYFAGEIEFKKPISCYLFPIRVYGKKRNIMRYEKITECNDALDKGVTEDKTVFEFLKQPIIDEFGIEFYKAAKEKFLHKNLNKTKV
jgi:hypothetical protein